MTAQEKIDFIKKNLAAPRTVNALSAAHSSTFDPRATFSNKSINVVYPARDDFSDDRVNTDDEGETSESHRVGYASDLLNCAVSGEAGPGCSHGDIDHVARATECLQNYARDEAMRDKNLADAGRMHSVRFVA